MSGEINKYVNLIAVDLLRRFGKTTLADVVKSVECSLKGRRGRIGGMPA